jgi:hypothetical protein
MKLTIEEKELLQELLLSPGWPVVLKVVSGFTEDIDKRVLTYNLKDGAQGLVEEKARSEGAHRLRVAIENIKSNAKKQGLL